MSIEQLQAKLNNRLYIESLPIPNPEFINREQKLVKPFSKIDHNNNGFMCFPINDVEIIYNNGYTNVVPYAYCNPPHHVYNDIKTDNGYSTKYKPCFYHDIAYITYPGVKRGVYLITSDGRVFNTITQRWISLFDNSGDGHLYVNLYLDETYPHTSNRAHIGIHRLVAYQFCNPPINYEELYVNHIDNNPLNNRADNLEWVTSSANARHAAEILSNGRLTYNGNNDISFNDIIVTRICELFEKGYSNTETMRILGLPINDLTHGKFKDIRARSTWKHISCKYNFSESSKNHAYTIEERDKIKTLILQGKHNKEIFYIMQGREYVAATDRNAANYKAIDSVRIKLRKQGYNV